MHTLQELIELAKKAVGAGNLAEAERYTNQAKALRAVNALEADSQADTDLKSVQTQLAAAQAKVAELEATIRNAPAQNKAGVRVEVVEDETDKKAAQPWANLGEQLFAIKNAALRPHQVDERLKAAQRALPVGSNEGQSSDGGFLIQQQFTDGIVEKMHATAVLASRVDRQAVGPNANGLKINVLDETSRANGSRWGGMRGYWLAEGGTLTASQPRFNQMEWNLHKLGVLWYATEELLMDTVALSGRAATWASKELAFMLDDAILNGSGAGQPHGILNSAALVSVAKETGQAATTLVTENIQKMWSRMWAPSRSSAIWLINQDVEPQLGQLSFPVGTGGVPAYLPPGGLSQSPYSSLYGKPVIPTEFNATLGTVGDIMLVDLSQYLTIDKGGVQGASSIHVQFLTDQECFRWIYRVDGQPMWQTVLTPYKGSNTLSPFVALATRA